MTMYEYMKETVVMCAFIMIITMDLWFIGYLAVSLVKWVRKKLRGKDAPQEEAEAAETE